MYEEMMVLPSQCSGCVASHRTHTTTDVDCRTGLVERWVALPWHGHAYLP